MGMGAVFISDGFVVDITPPIAATVLLRWLLLYTDKVAQSSGENYLVRWYGIVDTESTIDHNEIAVGEPSNLYQCWTKSEIQHYWSITY